MATENSPENDPSLCSGCPGEGVLPKFRLISDAVQFFAAREAAHNVITSGSVSDQEIMEEARGLASYCLNDEMRGYQGTFEVDRNPACLYAGIECARRLLRSECTHAERWFRDNFNHTP